MSQPIRVHVVAGGFPPGKHAGHDIDYARMRILQALQSNEDVHATVSSDFTDCDKWIADCQLLVCYVAGPFADEHQNGVILDWLNDGGRWLALHGSTGGMPERTSQIEDLPSARPFGEYGPSVGAPRVLAMLERVSNHQ